MLAKQHATYQCVRERQDRFILLTADAALIADGANVRYAQQD